MRLLSNVDFNSTDVLLWKGVKKDLPALLIIISIFFSLLIIFLIDLLTKFTSEISPINVFDFFP